MFEFIEYQAQEAHFFHAGLGTAPVQGGDFAMSCGSANAVQLLGKAGPAVVFLPAARVDGRRSHAVAGVPCPAVPEHFSQSAAGYWALSPAGCPGAATLRQF